MRKKVAEQRTSSTSRTHLLALAQPLPRVLRSALQFPEERSQYLTIDMPGKILSAEKVAESDVESESSASESESDKSSSESSETPASQKRKQPTTSNDALSTPQSTAKRAKISQPANTTTSKSSTSDESSSEDDGDQQNEEATTTSPNGIIASRVAQKDYSPPEGFVAVKSVEKSASNEVDKLFSPENLAGKQILHIMLAPGIPITSLKEVDLERAKAGTNTISHDGIEYGIRVESSGKTDKDNLGLLVPIDGGAGYKPASTTFGTTVQIQEASHPPAAYSIPKDTSTGKRGAGQPTIPRAKEVRQQPKGLRMRYWPAGFEDGDVDMSKTETSVRGRPEALGVTEAAAKREDTSSSDGSSSGSDEE